MTHKYQKAYTQKDLASTPQLGIEIAIEIGIDP